MRISAAALLLLGLGLASTVAAQEEQTEAQRLERAVILFQESETLYNQGEFAQAAAMLRRAHDLHPDPTLQFNLARALEGMGDLDGAIESYERYLTEADEPQDAGAIRQRVATLRVQRNRLSQAEEREGPEDTTDAPSEEEAARGGGADIEIAPWLVAGGGVLVVGVGIALGLVAQDYGSQAAAEPTMQRAVELQSEGETFATLANVMFIAGGVIAAAGVTWGVISLVDGSADEPEVALSIEPGGARLRGSF